MQLDALRSYCLSLPGTSEDQPFGDDVLAFRVGPKIFALLSLSDVPPRVNLKCDPECAIALRERYEAVVPGYHMNKRHWNTVVLDGTVPPDEVRGFATHSYDLVRSSLPAAERARLADLK